jgi:hypothetical protein
LGSFTDLDALVGMVPSHVVTRLSAIDFGRGSEALYRDQMPGLLTELADQARVLSITADARRGLQEGGQPRRGPLARRLDNRPHDPARAS